MIGPTGPRDQIQQLPELGAGLEGLALPVFVPPGFSASITIISPVTMPIQQLNLNVPGRPGVNSLTLVSPGVRGSPPRTAPWR